MALINNSLACSADKPEIFSSCCFCSSISSSYWSSLRSISFALFFNPFSLRRSSWSLRSYCSILRSICSSFCIRCLSRSLSSERVSWVSASKSLFILKRRSLISRSASFRSVSALRFESMIKSDASPSAALIFCDEICPFTQKAIAKPTPKQIIATIILNTLISHSPYDLNGLWTRRYWNASPLWTQTVP